MPLPHAWPSPLRRVSALLCHIGGFSLVLGLLALGRAEESAALSCAGVRCENAVNPTAVDVPQPDLTWQLRADVRGIMQSAYQVVVASTPEAAERGQGDLWDS